MAKNLYGKTVTADKAYAVYSADGGNWMTYVLKVNQAPGSKKGRYSSAFVKVVSQFTGPSGDLGDSYLSDIQGTLVSGVDVRG